MAEPLSFFAIDRGTASVGASLIAPMDGRFRLLASSAAPAGVDLTALLEDLVARVVATDPALGYPTNAVVADFDGDGKRDVAVLADIGDGDTATVEIFPGNGDGTFRSAQDFPTDSGAGRLTVANLDGVGLPDLVNLNREANVVTVLLNGTPAPEPGPLEGAVAAAAALAVRGARRAGARNAASRSADKRGETVDQRTRGGGGRRRAATRRALRWSKVDLPVDHYAMFAAQPPVLSVDLRAGRPQRESNPCYRLERAES